MVICETDLYITPTVNDVTCTWMIYVSESCETPILSVDPGIRGFASDEAKRKYDISRVMVPTTPRLQKRRPLNARMSIRKFHPRRAQAY